MHTPVDVPAVSRLVLYGNEFQVWRGPTAGVPPARQRVISGAGEYLRLRKGGVRGSDIPAYPDRSWSPPESTQATASSPGAGWAAGPETFVSDDFWKAVRRTAVTDPSNVLTFKHFLGFLNCFVELPGSLPITTLRDDGTHPAEPVAQFGPGRPLRTHPAWLERSVSFLDGNVYLGMKAAAPTRAQLERAHEGTADGGTLAAPQRRGLSARGAAGGRAACRVPAVGPHPPELPNFGPRGGGCGVRFCRWA